MQIPATWNTNKRQRSSRSRGDTLRKKTRWAYEQAEPVSLNDLCNNICQTILDSKSKEADETLTFETVLSNVPYQKILENLFGGGAMPECAVPVVTKAFEESFMRECIYQNERKCVMGNECECRFVDKDNQFTGVEFLVPGQSVSECTPQMCVLCSRKHTQKMYYDMLFRPPVMHIGTIQRYGVLCSVEGEYSVDYALIMPPHGPVQCMPYPSPVHSRNNYSIRIHSAHRYIVQRSEVAFRLPSLIPQSSA
jgi:hypothetical protein